VITGLVLALGTKWGLFRHWLVLISFLATLAAAVVLLLEMQTAVAADPTTAAQQLRSLGGTLPNPAGGFAVLLAVLVLNVCKPKGLTPYGWRKLQEERRSRVNPSPASRP
jgi:hypothetical protein